MGIAMMAFLHGYLKYTQPLFMQAIMGLKGLYDAKPVAIHILGKPAEGDLKRPFKAASMFGGMYIGHLVVMDMTKRFQFLQRPLARLRTQLLLQKRKRRSAKRRIK
jgi:hypothetical protein